MFVSKTESTNSLLAQLNHEQLLAHGSYVYTYCQTAGRGQVGNVWHSEPEQNILLSTLIRPNEVHIAEQFVISEIVALAALRTLSQYTEGICIKWPNDIYWQNRKIAGILIENAIVGAHIKHSIAGIGININQTTFPDGLPNPISLAQITGKTYDKEQILNEYLLQLEALYKRINDRKWIHCEYLNNLFRKEGMHQSSIML